MSTTPKMVVITQRVLTPINNNKQMKERSITKIVDTSLTELSLLAQ